MLNPEKTRSAGFTLLELVIVIMTIGIMIAVVVPRFADALSQHRLDAAAKRIELDLKLARRRARTYSSSQSIQFDTIAHAYILPGVPHMDHPDSDYRIELAGAPYGAWLVSADFGGDTELLFDGYGVPDSGGTIVVRSGRYQKTITVNSDTGKVDVQ